TGWAIGGGKRRLAMTTRKMSYNTASGDEMATAKTSRTGKGGLPAGLSQPAIRALNGAGITRLKQLTKFSEADLLKLHGLGPNGIATVKRALAAQGLSLAAAKPAAAKGKPTTNSKKMGVTRR